MHVEHAHAILFKGPGAPRLARTMASLSAGSGITPYISLGGIARFSPAEKLHEILKATHRASRRERDLPAPGVVYSVLARAL